ncbi:MAG: hypothetical protein MK078_15340 [Crocinitomicaceae bacterium]|nr:hypothetical protein [Crocinitomicaceae bacterium]
MRNIRLVIIIGLIAIMVLRYTLLCHNYGFIQSNINDLPVLTFYSIEFSSTILTGLLLCIYFYRKKFILPSIIVLFHFGMSFLLSYQYFYRITEYEYLFDPLLLNHIDYVVTVMYASTFYSKPSNKSISLLFYATFTIIVNSGLWFGNFIQNMEIAEFFVWLIPFNVLFLVNFIMNDRKKQMGKSKEILDD